MTEKQKALREEYLTEYMDSFKESQKLQSSIRSSRLAIANAQEQLQVLDEKRFKRFEKYLDDLSEAAESETSAPAAPTWHPASEKPESAEGWFLALTKDNLPFLTHFINGWLPQVDQWQYICMPTNAPS